MIPCSIKLIKTCNACPEQYDVYLNNMQLGYLRLRWGFFRVDYLFCGGEQLYVKDFMDEFKGNFKDDIERRRYLDIACELLLKKYDISKKYNGYYIVDDEYI
jgi:hypothetical protein